MIKVVIRHCSWYEPEEIGEFPSKDIKEVVGIIKENGVYTSVDNDTIEKYEYSDSYYNLDIHCFEIIVE
jgi:predicted lactoylglutathione lyase